MASLTEQNPKLFDLGYGNVLPWVSGSLSIGCEDRAA